MSVDELKVYLAVVLNQDACKATLMGALKSRLAHLRSLPVTDDMIIEGLNALHQDPYQMNTDIIDEAIEWLYLTCNISETLTSG